MNQLKFTHISLSFALALFCLFGCSDKDATYSVTSEPFDEMSPQEQSDFAPTPLFRALYRNDEELFNAELANIYVDLPKKNIEGDTLLAVAIKQRRSNMVDRILEYATYEDLQVPNKEGRSYLSLLAEHSMESGIDIVADKYIYQLGFGGHVRNNFYAINFSDDFGRLAHDYAERATIMDKLEDFQFYGVLRFHNAWDDFYFHGDNDGNSFLHLAALNDKTEVVQWTTRRLCGPNSWETADSSTWLGSGASTIGWAVGGIRDWAQDNSWLPLRRRYVNRENNEGNTALHMAAMNGNYRSAELLLQCDQINPVQKNHNGQIPLVLLLASLDEDQTTISENYKMTFSLLLEQLHPIYRGLWQNFKNMANEKDEFDKSALHYAARLKDKYFYEMLKKYELPNQDDNGITSEDRN